MKNYEIFKIELKKAIYNRGFIIALSIGIFLSILSLIYQINVFTKQNTMLNKYLQNVDISYNPDLTGDILFNKWIGAEGGSLGSIVYFFVFPLLIVLPYGWSFASEIKSGYSKQMVVRGGRLKYIFAKYLAMFTSAGLAMILPMIFSILITACVFPIKTPFVLDDVMYGVFSNSLFAGLYYTKPILYIVLYLLIDFVICGLMGCICIAVPILIKQKYIVMIIPMLVCLGIEYISKYVFNFKSYYNYEISPLYFLKPVQGRFPASIWIILLTGLMLFIITFIVPAIWEKKHEIY